MDEYERDKKIRGVKKAHKFKVGAIILATGVLGICVIVGAVISPWIAATILSFALGITGILVMVSD